MEKQKLENAVKKDELIQEKKTNLNFKEAFYATVVGDNYIKTATLGATLMLGTLGVDAINNSTMPANDIYNRAVFLENEINSSFNAAEITHESNKEEVMQDITNYFSFIEEKKARLEGLVNTPEYKNILEARQKREEFNKYMDYAYKLGSAIMIVGVVGSTIKDAYGKEDTKE